MCFIDALGWKCTKPSLEGQQHCLRVARALQNNTFQCIDTTNCRRKILQVLYIVEFNSVNAVFLFLFACCTNVSFVDYVILYILLYPRLFRTIFHFVKTLTFTLTVKVSLSWCSCLNPADGFTLGLQGFQFQASCLFLLTMKSFPIHSPIVRDCGENTTQRQEQQIHLKSIRLGIYISVGPFTYKVFASPKQLGGHWIEFARSSLILERFSLTKFPKMCTEISDKV